MDLAKKGFTLAEIVIVIGIIGMIAAMAFPSLNTAYRKRLVETRTARTYSIVSQAIKLAESETCINAASLKSTYKDAKGEIGYSWALSHAAFEQFFSKHIKTSSFYPQSKLVYIKYGEGVTYTHTSYVWYNLPDGTLLGFCMAGNFEGLNFIIIPDPSKKILLAGQDVFTMTFQDKNQGFQYYPLWYERYKNGQITRDDLINYCSANVNFPAYSSTKDSFCFHLLLLNNFKIPNDYPLKF